MPHSNSYADPLEGIGAQFKEAKQSSQENSGDRSHSKNLQTILESQERLKEAKSQDIKFSRPVIKQGENAIIFPSTINVIQGPAGSHKSRLAEIFGSAILKKYGCNKDLLGLERTDSYDPYLFLLVDTERNLKDQLPFALQSIQCNAGYYKSEHPENFKYISLLEIDRRDRYSALNEYLNHIRKESDKPLFIVLDVSTDCIEDFNKVDKSMQLIDMMNMTVNKYNAIFLCLIHENPGVGGKARGHFGTELMNKATTVMQISFEKNGNQEDTEIIRVKYLKCRSTARYKPYYIKYSDENKSLILAENSEVSGVLNSRKQKAGIDDMIDFIEIYMGDGSELSRRELLDKLREDFKASERTVEARLSEMLMNEVELTNQQGEPCKLQKEVRDKVVYYSLMPLKPQ